MDLTQHLRVAALVLSNAERRETFAGTVIKPSLLADFLAGLAAAHGIPEGEHAIVLSLIEHSALLTGEALRPYSEVEAAKFRNLSVAAGFARLGRLNDDMAAADDLAFQRALAEQGGQLS